MRSADDGGPAPADGSAARPADRARCAVHPARPAVDACPACGRPRCAADAAGAGCAACRTARSAPAAPPAPPLERLVRAALAGLGAAVLGGLVAAQYVDAELFAYLTPAVVGAGCGAAAQAAAGGPRRGATADRVRVVAAGAGVLGVALGFLLEGSRDPVSAGALLPYGLAVLGAVLWTLPPKRRAPTAGRAG
jgi:hypothetical protein